jgi:PLD-like domain
MPIRVTAPVGATVEAFIRRNVKGMWIASGFIGTNLDKALKHWGVERAKILIGIDPAHGAISREMDRCLKTLRRMGEKENKAIEVRLLANLHAKIYISPGREFLVGSMNLSANGLERLEEVCLAGHRGPALVSLQRLFLDRWWHKAEPLARAKLMVTKKGGQGQDTTRAQGGAGSKLYTSAFSQLPKPPRAASPPPAFPLPEVSVGDVFDWIAENMPRQQRLEPFFADLIACHPDHSDTWNTSFWANLVRINAGPMTSADLHSDDIFLHLSGLRGSDLQRLRRVAKVNEGMTSALRLIDPAAISVNIPLGEVRVLRSLLLRGYRNFVAKVDHRDKYWKFHDPSVITYVERKTKRRLPKPSY